MKRSISRRSWATLGVCAVAALSAAACGSSGGSSASGASAIVIGGDGTLTLDGASFALATGMDTGARARFWLANQDGGIDGHKIDYLGTLDDTGSAQTLAGNLSKLILADHVSVIAPYVSLAPYDQNIVDQNHVLVFGSDTSYTECTDKWFYSAQGCAYGPAYTGTDSAGAITEAVMHKTPGPSGNLQVTKGYEYALELASASAPAVPGLAYGAKADGWSVCYQDASVPAATTDFSTYAAKIMRTCNNGKGPQGLAVSLATTAQNAEFVQALRTLGWKGQAETAGYDPTSLTSSEISQPLQGLVTFFPDVSLPGVGEGAVYSQIAAALKGIGEASTPITAGLLNGWVNADMAIQALEKTGAKTASTQVETDLQSWTYPGIAGLAPQAAFPAARTYPIPCYNVEQVVGSQYKQLYPLECAQDVSLKDGSIASISFTP
jgi:branched-chain amino acid transport system substrate-binding protein